MNQATPLAHTNQTTDSMQVRPLSTLSTPTRMMGALRAIAVISAVAITVPLAACAQAGMGAHATATSAEAAQAQSNAKANSANTDTDESSRQSRESAAPSAAEQQAAAKAKAEANIDLPDHELTSQIVFQVLAAEIALQRGQVAPAYQTYLALARDTQDPRLAQRAAEIAVGAQSPSDALIAARLWHQYAPHSAQASQFDASLLVLNGYLDEAQPLLARQLAAVPDDQRGDAILSLQLLIARGSDRIGGVRTLKILLRDDMQRPEALTAIGRQEMIADDLPSARGSFVAALALKPDYEPAALLLAQMGPDERRQAISIVSDYTKQHPKDRSARFLLAQLYLSDNQVDAARQQFEAMHKANPKDPAPLLALGLISMQDKQEKDAEQYFTEYANLAEKQPVAQRVDAGPAYLYLAQIAADRKDTAGAQAWLAKVDPGSNQYVTAQIARAQLLVSAKQYDEASAVLNATKPRNAREAVALGRADAAVMMQAGRYAQAEQRLANLLELVPGNPDVLYDHAMAAEKNGHDAVMESDLRRLIAIDPTNAQAYNALGYSLADRNQRLPEADKLIQKALSLSPGDAYIMDSAGWVKFKLGDKDAALALLRKAYAAQPNAEIGAHLGEVLWSQGKREDARAAFRSAMKLDPTDDTLVHTLERLKITVAP